MRDLPNGWILATLADVGEWSSGGTPNRKKPEYFGGDIPWVLTGDLDDGPLLDTPSCITKLGLKYSSAKIFPRGTILVAMYGATIGKLATLGMEAATNQACAALLPSSENKDSLPYLYYFLLSQRENMRKAGKGGAQPNISQTILKALSVPIAPLNEQRRIVEKIETLFARLDQGEAALRHTQTLLARYRQSVLKAAVTGALTADWRAANAHRLEHGRDLLARILQTRRETWQGRGKYQEPAAPDTTGLPELPEGWVWATVEQLGFVVSGQTPKGVESLVDSEGTIPWFKVSSMNEPGNEVDLKTSQWMFTEVGAKAAGFNLLPAEAIVFPKRGGAILTNKKRRLGCRAALDLNTMGFVPVGISDFVWTFFQGLDLRSIYDGSNVPQINYHDIADVPIAVPSCAEEADAIAESVKERIDQIGRLETWCQTELTRSAALRQSILKDAFAGKLVPQDPSDEPATELLARIRASRTTPSGRVGKAQRAHAEPTTDDR